MKIEFDFYEKLPQKSTETNFYGPEDEMLKNVAAYCSYWKIIIITHRRQKKGWRMFEGKSALVFHTLVINYLLDYAIKLRRPESSVFTLTTA